MNNSLSVRPKTLNLNKRAYIEYLKGKRPAWLFNNHNFVQEAKKHPELLKGIDPYRFKRYVEGRKDLKMDEMPGPMVDGIENQKYYHLYFKHHFPNHEIIEFTYEESFKPETFFKVNDYIKNNDNFIIFEAPFLWNFKGYNISVRADIMVKTNGKISYYEAKAVNDIPCLLHGIDIGFQYHVLKRMGYDVDSWDWYLLTMNKSFVLKNDLTIEAKDLYQVNDKFSNKKFTPPSKASDIDIDIDRENKIAQRTMLIRDYLDGKDFTNVTVTIKNHFIDFESKLEDMINIQLLDQMPDERLQRSYRELEDGDYLEYLLFLEGIVKGNHTVFDYIGDSGFTYYDKLHFHQEGINFYTLKNDDAVSTMVWVTLDRNSAEFSQFLADWETKRMMGKKVSELKYDEDGNLLIRKNLDKLVNIDKFNNDPEYAKSVMFKYKLRRVIQKYSTIDNEVKYFSEGIKKEYRKYKAPIYMYDFETVNNAQPQIQLASPYEQVPFQFSVHIITDVKDYDFQTGKNVIHKDFLVKSKTDFRTKFWKEFINTMKSEGPGTYVSYNKSFEKTVIRKEIEKQDLINLSDSDFEFLQKIHTETIDLQDFFKKFYYVAPTFMGSTSIKKVGPHFAPELDYSKLKINKGDKASHECKIWLLDNSYEQRWKDVRNNMLKYCEYDTLSMVAILQGLKKYE